MKSGLASPIELHKEVFNLWTRLFRYSWMAYENVEERTGEELSKFREIEKKYKRKITHFSRVTYVAICSWFVDMHGLFLTTQRYDHLQESKEDRAKSIWRRDRFFWCYWCRHFWHSCQAERKRSASWVNSRRAGCIRGWVFKYKCESVCLSQASRFHTCAECNILWDLLKTGNRLLYKLSGAANYNQFQQIAWVSAQRHLAGISKQTQPWYGAKWK